MKRQALLNCYMCGNTQCIDTIFICWMFHSAILFQFIDHRLYNEIQYDFYGNPRQQLNYYEFYWTLLDFAMEDHV